MQQPPNVNGLMQLTAVEKSAIKVKLDGIIAAFVPTDEQPKSDTFYIVSNYNRENPGITINGDTVETILHGHILREEDS